MSPSLLLFQLRPNSTFTLVTKKEPDNFKAVANITESNGKLTKYQQIMVTDVSLT